jgi:AraC-like DNA-binding protein
MSRHPATRVIGAEGRYFGEVSCRFSACGASGGETHYAGGAVIPRHSHEYPSLFILLEGTFESQCRRQRWQLGAGVATILGPGEQHEARVLSSRARGFNVELHSAPLQVIPSASQGQAVCTVKVAQLLGQLHQELHARDEARQLAIDGLLWQLLASLLREPAKAHRVPPAWLERAIELLNDTLDEPLDSAALCGLLGVDAREVTGVFRHFLGCTPAAYRRLRRMEVASRRLVETQEPLATIAAMTGFYDQAHFCRCFRQVHGYTPSRYRHLFGCADATRKIQPARNVQDGPDAED